MTDSLKLQLTKAQKELEMLKAEYNEFVYIVSHDLKAPLRQIEGFTEMLSNKYIDNFDDKSKRHLNLIMGGSNKAKQLLDALIGYSRLNTQQTPFTLIDCNELVEEAKLILLPLIDERDVKIICPKLPEVIGDKPHLFQLFYHLIHNAIIYQQPDNAPEITINIEDKKGYWQFSIKDNGIGIKDNLTEKIFKVLRRAVSDKLYPGLGMGLALSAKILQHHNGSIWVESEKNIGSTFYFTLPKEIKDE